jgi:hypothetical protein
VYIGINLVGVSEKKNAFPLTGGFWLGYKKLCLFFYVLIKIERFKVLELIRQEPGSRKIVIIVRKQFLKFFEMLT